jgi:tight adherence protein B
VILLAGLFVGVAVALLAGLVCGVVPRTPLRGRRPRIETTRGQLWLHQAGVALTPRQFWAGCIAVGVVTFSILATVTGVPLVAFVPSIAVALLPRAYFGRRRGERLRLVHEAWPDGLRDVLASISAGRSLSQALSTLASSGPAPLREAFDRFPMLSRMLGAVPALEVIKEELADPTSDRVMEVLILAHERGGQIVRQVLEDLVAATTRDLKVLEQIQTEGLEIKINARAVLVLPWIVLVALTLQPGPFRDFYRSSAGLFVVIVGAALSLVGYWLVARLGRSDTELRVFGSSAPVAGRTP